MLTSKQLGVKRGSKYVLWMTETAKGQSQAWDASDRAGLEEP